MVIDSTSNSVLIDMFEGQTRAMVMLSLSTGMRRGEVCGLKWDKVENDSVLVHRSLAQLAGSRLVLKEPKTKKSYRRVTLPAQTRSEFKSQRARQSKDKLAAGGLYHDQGYIFADPLGEPVTPQGYTKRFRNATRGTEFDKINLQALRHSHASQLIKHGVNIKTISERLGHSTIVITLDTYGHLLPGMDEEAASIMNELLS